MIEIALLVTVFIFSLLLLKKDLHMAMKVLVVLSVLLHKEVFSIYKWNFLPARFFMVAFSLYAFFYLAGYLRRGTLRADLKQFSREPFLLFLSLTLIVRAISIINTKSLPESLQLLVFFATMVILGFVVFFKYRSDSERAQDLIKFLFPVMFGLCLFGLFQLILYTNTGFIVGALWNIPGRLARVGSAFWDVNHFGAFLAMVLPVLGSYIIFEKTWKKRILYSVYFFSGAIILLVTNSRTSWIAGGISLLVFSLMLLYKKYGKKGIYIILGTLFLTIVLGLIKYQDRGSSFRAYIKDYFHYRLDSFASHVMLLKGSYQIFEKYPILGGGYGGFFEHFRTTEVSAEFFGRDPAALNTRVPPHTIWGELISETGVVGLVVFILLLLSILGPLFYSATNSATWKDTFVYTSMFSSLVGILIAGVFYSYNSEFFFLILFLYFIFGYEKFRKESSYKVLIDRYFDSSKLLFILLLVLSIVILFQNLGKNHLVPWDEAIYAKIAKNMVQKNEYLTMYWYPEISWYEKPPFFMWMMALSMRIFGMGDFAPRFPSALFGLGTIVFTYLIGKKLFGRQVGLLSALSLLSGVHFLYYARASMIDVTNTFFITASIYFYIKYIEDMKIKSIVIAGIFMGFSVLTKGAVGLLVYGIFGMYQFMSFVLKNNKLTKALVKDHLIFLLVSMIVFMPWHIYMVFKFGNAFIANYLYYHVFDRALHEIEDKGRPFLWYLEVMKVSMRIWFLPFLISIPFFIREFIKKNYKSVLLVSWFMVIFLLFSAAKSKLTWYIMPLYPVASIMSGYVVVTLYNLFSDKFQYFKRKEVMFLVFYFGVSFSLFYTFLVRKMFYTSDLTGQPARLLLLKDKKFGVESKVYIDRVEAPIVLYYTDGPFEVMDIDPKAGRFPVQLPGEELIILAKRGRYSENIPGITKKTDIAGEEQDYILWSYHKD